MKTILFNATGDEGFSGRLDAVLDLARAFDAHVTLLHAIPYEAAGAIDFHGAAFAAMVPFWRKEAEKLREKTLDDLSNEGVSWNWVEAAGPVALAMLRESSLHDLAVVSARDPNTVDGTPSFTAGELAVTADCPVLVLPDTCKRFRSDGARADRLGRVCRSLARAQGRRPAAAQGANRLSRHGQGTRERQEGARTATGKRGGLPLSPRHLERDDRGGSRREGGVRNAGRNTRKNTARRGSS